MTKLSILLKMSPRGFIQNFKHHPEQYLKYFIIIASVVFLVLMVTRLADEILLYIRDRHLRKKGVTLKLLPWESCSMKDTEALIKNIHGMLLNNSFWKYIYGRPYISFEILADGSPDRRSKEVSGMNIAFYLWVPENYRDMIIDRIHSTYPGMSVEILENPQILPKRLHRKQSVYGTEMELGYHHMLKIKTRTDTDIIGSLLGNMRELQWHEKVLVQIMTRPLDHKWQAKGRKVLEQYERDNRRPKRRSNFGTFLSELGNELGKEINEYTNNKGKNAKSRIDRREIKVASEKLVESGFEVVIRVLALGDFRKGNRVRVKAVSSAFNEMDGENRFKRTIIYNKGLFYKRTRTRMMYSVDRSNIFTTSELSNFLLRFPSAEMLDTLEEVVRVRVKQLPPPVGIETKQYIIGENLYRGKTTPIGIKDADLRRHGVVQGATGSGKSEWLKTLLLPHINMGRGFILIEPHGKLADELLELIPPEHHTRVVWCDLFDDNPFPFNFCKVIKRPGQSFEDMVEKTTEEITEIFSTLFKDTWSTRNAHFFVNALKTIIEMQDGRSIGDLKRLFNDTDFREYALTKVKDHEVRDFWLNQFKEGRETEQTVLSLMHKIGQFLNSKKIMRSVCQEDCIDFLDALNNDKIVIFRFSKDKMSEDRIKFLGSIAIKLTIVAAFQRDKSKWDSPYIIALDEAQNFLTANIKTVIYELRKYGLSLWPLHQGLEQLDEVPGLQQAIYGNVGTKITFMTGSDDAKFFATVHQPRLTEKDIESLPSRHGYVRTLVNGVKTESFNIYTLDAPQVDKAEGLKNAFEIKKLNAQNRKHYKEIDRDLSKKIGDYKGMEEEDVDTHKVAIDDEEETELQLIEDENNGYEDINDGYEDNDKNFDQEPGESEELEEFEFNILRGGSGNKPRVKKINTGMTTAIKPDPPETAINGGVPEEIVPDQDDSPVNCEEPDDNRFNFSIKKTVETKTQVIDSIETVEESAADTSPKKRTLADLKKKDQQRKQATFESVQDIKTSSSARSVEPIPYNEGEKIWKNGKEEEIKRKRVKKDPDNEKKIQEAAALWEAAAVREKSHRER